MGKNKAMLLTMKFLRENRDGENSRNKNKGGVAKVNFYASNDMSDRDPTVRVEGLSHCFEGSSRVAVRDVDLVVAQGEFVSIVGPSGCGKTTILNVLAGLIKPSSGIALVMGKECSAGNEFTAYMMARDALFPWRTAIENVELGAEFRGVPKEVRRVRAIELLGMVGLSSFERAYPKQLSHGMRQRVALARTFCVDAALLLMDEPFAALDPQTKIVLEDILLDLWHSEKRSVVFVTHDISEAIALSDRVVVMASGPGRVVRDVKIELPRPRSVRQLQGDPVYHEIYARLWQLLGG